jgi:excisionase family DNA binding protein
LAVRQKEAAGLLGISISTLKRWLGSGKLTSVNIGNLKLIPMTAITALLEGRGRG